ncbi:MAG: toll/interleukin-1 receptor domain-containing protein [Gemmataceae bacterium]|nr:toll/interleukin-1 receptor domain-containing protein [Gemmataceae bacterium]
MKVFLSHARKDAELAFQLAKRLEQSGFRVWSSEKEIVPGDNWAKKIGKALEDSDLMVLLFTPSAMESDSLRHDVEFAIGSRKYEHRVFSVFVGSETEADKNMPWILRKLPNRQVGSAKDFSDVAKEIQALFAVPT